MYKKSIENPFSSFKTKYLNSKARKLEFISYFAINILLSIIQINTIGSTPIQSLTSQMQSFVSLLIAFRFGVFGACATLIFTLKNIIIIIVTILTKSNDFSYYSGLIFSAISALFILSIGFLSSRQEKHRSEMQELLITDDLTGLHNFRHFHVVLDNELRIASDTSKSVALIIIDIDNFRMYNDLYGHEYGNNLLKNTSNILNNIIDKENHLFRIGGDEFALIVRDKDTESVETLAKKLYNDYNKEKKAYYSDSIRERTTFSIGFSAYPDISKTKEELLSHAGLALYRAKNMGEDKVNFYQDVMIQINKTTNSTDQMIGVFKALLSTINAKDKYTVGHCERVSSYAMMVGEALELPAKEVQILISAGLLHDIGKIELPRMVLNKAGSLSDEEYQLMRQHPIYSANILQPLSDMENLIDYVKHHHERYDGKGYPDGLAGENISLGARILAIVDSFDAMVSERPYRKGMAIEQAFDEIERCSGTQFDPKIAKIFINVMRNKISIKYNYKVELLNSFVN